MLEEEETFMNYINENQDSNEKMGFKVEDMRNLSIDHLRQSRHDGLLRSKRQSEKELMTRDN